MGADQLPHRSAVTGLVLAVDVLFDVALVDTDRGQRMVGLAPLGQPHGEVAATVVLDHGRPGRRGEGPR